MKRSWLAIAAGAVPLLLAVVFIGFRQAPEEGPSPMVEERLALNLLGNASHAADTVWLVGDSGLQPIRFPHDTHAGQFTIDCQYCHFSAERSVDAGIPPVSVCMGCHAEGRVGGRTETAQAEIARVREYYGTGTPIPWKRIYKVRDHVKFPHMRHVAAGVTCQTCHGQVQEMGVLEEMAPEAGDLRMGWCVSCHLERGASRDCTVCHY